jgi:hypothetical protein
LTKGEKANCVNVRVNYFSPGDHDASEPAPVSVWDLRDQVV